MHIKKYEYNNNLLYLAAIEGNMDLVSQLINKGYPKSVNEIPKTIKNQFSNTDLNRLIKSFHNSTIILINHLLEKESNSEILVLCLKSFLHNKKIASTNKHYQNWGGISFYHGNIKGFEILCEIFGKDNFSKNNHLLWYIHQCKKNPILTHKKKKLLTDYIEKIGIDWNEANLCLVRWANTNRTITEFNYFYNKRKNALKKQPNGKMLLKKELSKSIEKFLFYNLDLEVNLKNPILNRIASCSELNQKSPYEGYWIILRKIYKISSLMNLKTEFIENYFYSLLKTHPKMINTMTNSKVRIPELFSVIEKIKLNQKLYSTLPNIGTKEPLRKI